MVDCFHLNCLEICWQYFSFLKFHMNSYVFTFKVTWWIVTIYLVSILILLICQALCNAYCGENYGSTDFDVLENVRDAILRMTHYWYGIIKIRKLSSIWKHLKSSFCKSISLFFRYNFMLLSRGSAVVGFVVMLGLLLAANMEFTGSIPQGFQVDGNPFWTWIQIAWGILSKVGYTHLWR